VTLLQIAAESQSTYYQFYLPKIIIMLKKKYAKGAWMANYFSRILYSWMFFWISVTPKMIVSLMCYGSAIS